MHHGDQGLLNLFDTFRTLLSPGGLLLLEPHGPSSYARTKELPAAVQKSLSARPLQIKPGQFVDLLRERGFHLLSRFTPEQHNHTAPGREVLLLRRG